MIPQPIDQVPLFVRLSQEERELVTARLRRRQVASGEVVFASGHPGDGLYVIIAGWVKLEDTSSNRALTLANLGAGSLLGEVDTLLGRPYTTSARAAANTQLLVLSRTDLEELISQHPSIGLKFSSTLGMRIAYLDRYLVQQRLRNIELLSSLSEDDLGAIAKSLDFKSYSRGDIIVEAGSPGDAALVIEEGEVRLISESSEGDSYEDLEEGGLFGHTALVTGKPYPATARAVTDVSIWVLPRSVYLELIQQHPAVKIAFSRALAETLGPDDQTEAVDHIRQLPLFSDVPTEALAALVSRMVLRHFPAGDVIYAEGTPGDALYVIESGEVKLLDSMFSDAQLLDRMRAGDSFGEMALLTGRTRAECARAGSDTTLWVLYKSDFDDLMVRYPEISVSLSRAITDRLGSRENDFLVRHLRRITLLSSLAASELRAISSKVKGLRFRPSEIICFAGQPAQTLFMIEMGEVKRIGVTPAGEPVLIDLLGPGDSFGEQAIVQNSAFTFTAQSIGDVELWTIAKDDFLAMMEKYSTLALTVTRLMADRLSRNQTGPGNRSTNVRGTAPLPRMPSGPRNQPVHRPGSLPPRSSGAHPVGNIPQQRPAAPMPGSRIQRPPSGARPVVRQTPPRPATEPPQGNSPARQAAPNVTPKAPPTRPQSQSRMTATAIPVPTPPPSVRQPIAHPAVRSPQRLQELSGIGTGPSSAATSGAQPNVRQPMAHPSLRSTQRLDESSKDWAALASQGTADGATGRRARSRRRAESVFFKEFGAWVFGLSFAAKVRATALTGLFVWFAFIALPATAITTVTSAVGGLQIFNPPPAPTGAPTAKPVALLRTSSNDGKAAKVAYALATETPVPTRTPKPTATRVPPTRVPATRAPSPTAAPVVAAGAPAATALPAAPPIVAAVIDPRLGPGGLDHLRDVRVVNANVARGQKFWHITKIGFENGPNEATSGCGDHNIKVNVRDESGKRVFGEKLMLTGGDPSPEYPEEKQQSDAENICGFNFSQETGGGNYTATLVNAQYPSDIAAGLQGLPVHQHVSYLITFQLTVMP